ncbi:putative baseplate assembly protein [Streptomyces sp. NA04227]|uniref:putative baseplate assembly protein n=1 Tax=Streptomyces sp. NA04227 TaxID=2742136 RepID=UPI00158FBBB8|nr:putative baseplate assembly protein [Streptomyces sp. NA04227]QKW08709.1 putative baseplate assembly protein [Streptomyces sp. NA04227]
MSSETRTNTAEGPAVPGGELVCRDDTRRRGRVRAAELNGIDTVEVSDDGLTLTVTFLGKAPHGLCPANIRIDGGRRITGIEAVEVAVEREEDPELDDRLYVTLDKAGDSSRYRLSVVEEDPYGRPGSTPYPGFEQRYFTAEFVFRPDCPSPFDCVDDSGSPQDQFPATPVVDYTARDYETIRRLLLDRLTLTTPDWVERNPADLGTTLVELLAYTGDRISYQQDAVATEAYLDTARRRVSVRRHVRLIDYAMHDGCNARAFVSVETAGECMLLPGTYRFAAVDVRTLDPHDRPQPGTVIEDRDLAVLDEYGNVEVFEPVAAGEPLVLREVHNAIRLWTWGGEVCALPKGATSATLRDEWADEACEGRQLSLRAGDLLVLEEVKGPRSGTPGDADPAHRQAVRLTSVTPAVDSVENQPVLEVTWAAEDALAFPLCLATLGGTDCSPVADVSVARGNVALVDHGRSLTFGPEDLPEWVTVPPDPAVVASCGPPDFGCPDREEGNAPARLINSLTEKADSGRLLTPEDIRELFTEVGEAQSVRAGLGLELAGQRQERVVPGTAYAQAGALRTLLAQSVYPGIVPRFRPVLQRSPVTQAVPFPLPERVAAGQAERLAAIPGRAEGRLVELWRSARDRDGLDEAEIAELTVLFGIKVIERYELRRHPVRALRELLHRSDELLAAKRRRIEVLTARARAGTVLDGHLPWEIAHSWGPAYAVGLHPQETELRGPASAALAQDPRAALPAVSVREDDPGACDEDGAGAEWLPRRDLLDSGRRDRHFVGELEDDGRIALRFGDGHHGARPTPGTRLALHYRLGGGTAGNVGAEAINHLVLLRDPEVTEAPPVAGVRNPLAATGGTAPEPVDQVRQLAPLDLRRSKVRAITAADYAELASALPGVQRAAADIRWTGSVQEVHIAVDPLAPATARFGGGEPAPALLDAVGQALQAYRRIGHDLVLGPARLVPLDIALRVCAAPGHQHGQILAELHRVLGSGRLPGGRLGFFHPDALSFGEPVRLSRLVAVAAAVPGVVSVRVTRLRRLFHEDRGEREDGVLRLGPLEIATCDSDPDRPENGRLEITLTGTGTPGGVR